MTPRYPGAFWRPTGDNGPMGRLPDVGTFHEAVSPNPTTVFGWAETAQSCHGYNGKGGTCDQYADFDRLVAGVADGNHHVVTWESYDGLKPVTVNGVYREIQTDDVGTYGLSADTGLWDAGQRERWADIVAWSEVELGSIPAREIPDSRPGQSGWAPHRWGIAPWRVAGGEVWTRHDGKPCPGTNRIAQIPGIIARAQVIAAAVRAGRCDWLPTGPVDLAAALARTTTAPAAPPVSPTPPPAQPAPATDTEDPDMRLIKTYDSKRRPVYGKILGDGLLYYIGGPTGMAEVNAYKAAGVIEHQVDSAVYNALPRAKSTNLVK